jgi:hypothetical protein
MKVELRDGFQYKGHLIRTYEILRKPVIKDRIEGALFSEEKFGKEVPDVVAIYIISKVGKFEGKEIPVEFLLDNLSIDDARILIQAIENFRPSQKGSGGDFGNSGDGEFTMDGDREQN